MASMRKIERFPTGIDGLDTVLGGGLFASGVYIVEGPAGSGKTILANHMCFANARRGGKSVYYTLLTESHDRLIGYVSELSFFDPKLVPDGVYYVSGFKVLESEGLSGVVRSIRDIVGSRGASLLVIDGVVTAEELAGSDVALKKFIHELQLVSSMYRCSIVLLTNTSAASRLHAEHTMVDGIISLSLETVRLKPRRFIDVPKFRGANQARGAHTLLITDDGIVVRPRMELLLNERRERQVSTGERAGYGVVGLDRMLHGGVPRATNSLLLGASGSGKTILALRFAAEGALRGEPSVHLSFYEQPAELIAKARRLGFDIEPQVQSGLLRLVWSSPVEANVDSVGEQLLRAIDDVHPRRVTIDGMHGFQTTSDPEERIRDFFAALADYMQASGITMVYTVESNEILGGAVLKLPFGNASTMTQNILLVRLAEIDGELRRSISVLKVRDSGFDPMARRLDIEDGAVTVGEPIVPQPELREPK